MSKRTLSSALAVLLVISLVTPVAFFVAPPKAHAQAAFTGCLGGLVGGLLGLGGSAATAVVSVPVVDVAGNTINGGTEGSTLAACINAFVITPLIKAILHALIQKLTATVINWINGGNGTGGAQYAQNLPGHLQTVGDTQALAFFAQFTANSNSPFAAAITSSLATNYLQNTSSAGFFAANKDTLITTTGSAANEQGFLNGNWAQGGVSSWFALTTQNQNNPYMLYQNSQSHLGNLISGAQNARLNELSWGNGFLSWCGPAGAGNGSGTATGNTCTNKDGTPGTTQTPGTIIAGYANQAVVSAGFQQLISATDIDSALNSIITALLNQVLGGVGGLFGASQGANGNASLTAQLQNYENNPTPAPTTNLSSTVASTVLQTATTNVTAYESSWGVILSSANFVSSSLTSLENSCPAEATAAQTAMTNIVAPLITQAKTANATAAAALALIQQVQNELNSGSPAYTADLQTLQNTPPSNADVSSAQQATQTTGGATATPAGSLNVSGGTTVDILALLSANVAALKAACP